MNRCAALVIFAAVGVLAQAAPAPEAFAIKMKTSAEGDSISAVVKKTQKMKMKIVDGDGKVLFEKNDYTVESLEYKETILKRQGKSPPTKLERAYVKADKKTGDKTEDLGLGGKTVVIEKKDDKYTFAFKDGKEVAGPAAEMLSKEFANKKSESQWELFLPKGAVKPGEEWKLEVEKFLKEMDKDIASAADLTKAKGTGKLVKAYKKEGKQFGELLFKIDVPIKALGMGQQEMKFADGAKMTMEMALDVCIDGTSDTGSMKMKMIVNGTASIASLPGSVVTLDISSGGEETQKDLSKK